MPAVAQVDIPANLVCGTATLNTPLPALACLFLPTPYLSLSILLLRTVIVSAMFDQIVDRVSGNTAVLGSLVALGVYYIVRFALGSGKNVEFEAPKLYDEKGSKDLTKLHSMVKSEFQKVRSCHLDRCKSLDADLTLEV